MKPRKEMTRGDQHGRQAAPLLGHDPTPFSSSSSRTSTRTLVAPCRPLLPGSSPCATCVRARGWTRLPEDSTAGAQQAQGPGWPGEPGQVATALSACPPPARGGAVHPIAYTSWSSG